MSIAANLSMMLALAATGSLSVLGRGIGANPAIKPDARTIAVPGPDACEYAEIRVNGSLYLSVRSRARL